MEVIIYYSLCLLARKKIVLNVSYFIGTLAFISFSYKSANQLYKIPDGIRLSIPGSIINISQQSNISLQYDERMEFLRNKCQEKNNPSSSMLSNINHPFNLLNHLGFLLRSQSLFYCSVPKVATRTLLTHITYLHIRDELITSLTNNSSSYFKGDTNPFNADYLNKILSNSSKNDSLRLLSRFLTILKSNASQIDLWLMYQKTVLPYLRLRTLQNMSILFSPSFTRVIFVRHPLERLASAYVDKIASIKAEPFTLYDTIRRAICRKFASSYLTPAEQKAYRINRLLGKQINEPCATKIPSFEHFIEYTMSDSLQIDVHWQSYSTLCDVCQIKYNFIGKYETIQEDLDFLTLKLGLNLTDWDINNHFSTGKTKEYYKLMYSKIPNHLICNLKDFYSADLTFFNYRLEDYLMDHQQINCPRQYYRRFRAVNY